MTAQTPPKSLVRRLGQCHHQAGVVIRCGVPVTPATAQSGIRASLREARHDSDVLMGDEDAS
jgi:hypothetical protein